MLSSNHLQCVVALAKLSSAEDAEWTNSLTQTSATGFLYAFPHSGKIEDGTDKYRRLWLVTCKHVIQGLSSDGSDEMIVRMNQMDQQNMVVFTILLQEQGSAPRWYLHPIKDIAVIPTSWQDLEDKGIQWRTFAAGRNAVTRREASRPWTRRRGYCLHPRISYRMAGGQTGLSDSETWCIGSNPRMVEGRA